MINKKLILIFLSLNIIYNIYSLEPKFNIPPKEYIDIMKKLNNTYFKMKRLDLVIRLFNWESLYKADRITYNKYTKSTDYGIAAINSKNLDITIENNFIDRYWKPIFGNKPFDWKNPEHNMFLGMAHFNNCLRFAGNYYDALIIYNAGEGTYKNKYVINPKKFKLSPYTKNIIEFVFQREFWKDNLAYHY